MTSVSRHFNSPNHRINEHIKFALIDESYSNVNLNIREGLWMNVLETVMKGINEKEESCKLDYQGIIYSKHFHHSRTCLPYMTSKIKQVTTLPLRTYKRNLLKPRKRDPQNRHTTRTLRMDTGTARTRTDDDTGTACNRIRGNRTLTTMGFVIRNNTAQ
jgi:hypothetical protein